MTAPTSPTAWSRSRTSPPARSWTASRGTGRPTASTWGPWTATTRASTSAGWSVTPRCDSGRWATVRSTGTRPRPMTSWPRWPASSKRRWRPARSDSRRRARCVTSRPTAATCRARSPTRASSERSSTCSPDKAAASSNAPPASTVTAHRSPGRVRSWRGWQSSPPAAGGELCHPRQLRTRPGLRWAVTVEAGGAFDDAAALSGEHVDERSELARVGKRARHVAAVGREVTQRARRRESERAGLHRLFDEAGHLGQLVIGRGLVPVERTVAHRPESQRGVTDHPADVDALVVAVQGPQVLAVGLPVPREAVQDRAGGDVLDRLHAVGEVGAVIGPTRRERHAAVAHHDRRDAVPTRGRDEGVPSDLRVVVGMDVDEPGRDDETVGINRSEPSQRRGLGDLGDPIAGDPDVCDSLRCSGAVDDRAGANDEIVGHPTSRPLAPALRQQHAESGTHGHCRRPGAPVLACLLY